MLLYLWGSLVTLMYLHSSDSVKRGKGCFLIYNGLADCYAFQSPFCVLGRVIRRKERGKHTHRFWSWQHSIYLQTSKERFQYRRAWQGTVKIYSFQCGMQWGGGVAGETSGPRAKFQFMPLGRLWKEMVRSGELCRKVVARLWDPCLLPAAQRSHRGSWKLVPCHGSCTSKQCMEARLMRQCDTASFRQLSCAPCCKDCTCQRTGRGVSPEYQLILCWGKGSWQVGER